MTTVTSSERVVAYVLTHHPKVAMTFISNEIAAMERAGWRVVPIALNSPEPDDLKSDWARRESERTVYLDRFSRLALAKRLGQHLVRHPVAIGRLLARVARSAGHDTSLLVTRFGHLLYATVVADEISRQDARHVHAHFGLSPASVAWFTSELTATTAPAQCSWSFTIHGFHDFVDERLARLDLKAAAANFVVCISDFTRSQLCRVTAPTHWDRFHVVRCGLDLDQFVPRPERALARPPHVLTVARLSPEKGHVTLLRAARLLADRGCPIELEFVGDGPFRSDLAREADRLGVHVRFTGELQPEQVRERLVAADIFCLPSFAEGLPVSIMEAMALGVPVVSSNVGGIPELARNDVTALSVAASDVEELAGAIEKMVTDEATRERLASAGTAAVRRDHDNASSVADLAALFAAELDRPRR